MQLLPRLSLPIQGTRSRLAFLRDALPDPDLADSVGRELTPFWNPRFRRVNAPTPTVQDARSDFPDEEIGVVRIVRLGQVDDIDRSEHRIEPVRSRLCRNTQDPAAARTLSAWMWERTPETVLQRLWDECDPHAFSRRVRESGGVLGGRRIRREISDHLSAIESGDWEEDDLGRWVRPILFGGLWTAIVQYVQSARRSECLPNPPTLLRRQATNCVPLAFATDSSIKEVTYFHF